MPIRVEAKLTRGGTRIHRDFQKPAYKNSICALDLLFIVIFTQFKAQRRDMNVRRLRSDDYENKDDSD